MKQINITKYLARIAILILFILVRTNYLINETQISSQEFISLAISNVSFPFGVIKETALNDFNLPLYYLLMHFVILSKQTIICKIFNLIICITNIFIIMKTGEKLLNKQLGILLASFLTINHFYLYYSNLIAPYCLNFLIGTILINCIIDFIKKPSKKHTRNLSILNIIFMISCNVGFLFVISELIIFYFIYKNKKYFKKNIIKLSISATITMLIILPILAIQYFNWTKTLFPYTMDGVGFNLNSLYLLLNDYISPFLSYSAPNNQTNSTLGMLYSLELNRNLKNINTIKILITLFYSSILPLLLVLFLSIKAYKKNYEIRIISLIALFNLVLSSIFMIYETIETSPIYIPQLFLAIIIILGYGILIVKDNFIKILIIFCLTTIQFINPEINSFYINVHKESFDAKNIFDNHLKEYNISKNSLIIMPYMGKIAQLYYKDYNFFDFDYVYLQKNQNGSFTKNLISKNTRTVNKNNINYLIRNYLLDNSINGYIAKYFLEKCVKNNQIKDNTLIIFIDKLNSKPITTNTINKIANINKYQTKLRKINFKKNVIQQNQTKMLFDALKSKTLYNMVNLIDSNFRLINIVQYKQIDNDYYKVDNSTKNVYDVLNAYDSDYVFLIYRAY